MTTSSRTSPRGPRRCAARRAGVAARGPLAPVRGRQHRAQQPGGLEAAGRAVLAVGARSNWPPTARCRATGCWTRASPRCGATSRPPPRAGTTASTTRSSPRRTSTRRASTSCWHCWRLRTRRSSASRCACWEARAGEAPAGRPAARGDRAGRRRSRSRATPTRAVKLVGRVLKRDPDAASAAVPALLAALTHESRDVQEPALEALERHADALTADDRARLAELADAVDPALRPRVRRSPASPPARPRRWRRRERGPGGRRARPAPARSRRAAARRTPSR